MLKRLICLAALLVAATPVAAQDAPHERQARQIFERLISFRSAAGHGQIAPMIAYVQETLRAGGVPDADMVAIPHEGSGALVVRVPGRDAGARPILFSAHMDVVDARPEDWQRDPFTLVEENGFFFGRGTGDNKAGVAAMISTILRLREAGRQPRRTLVFAFIGDEETGMATTGWSRRHAWVRNAEFAINTDAGGGLICDGRASRRLCIQAPRKPMRASPYRHQSGGHSTGRARQCDLPACRGAAARPGDPFPGSDQPDHARFHARHGDDPAAEPRQMRLRFVDNPGPGSARGADARPHPFGPRSAPPASRPWSRPPCRKRAAAGRGRTVNCRIFPGDTLDEVRARLFEARRRSPDCRRNHRQSDGQPGSDPREDVTARSPARSTAAIRAWRSPPIWKRARPPASSTAPPAFPLMRAPASSCGRRICSSTASTSVSRWRPSTGRSTISTPSPRNWAGCGRRGFFRHPRECGGPAYLLAPRLKEAGFPLSRMTGEV